jgi:hydroxyacylglutathione hydrolase
MAFVFEQFYLSCLSHASYLIGSEGVAAVIDPQRDVDLYIEAARERGLTIAHVIETHLHADFVSGHRELADRTGATIYLGAAAGATFPHTPALEGLEVRFGRCVLRFLETPGHTVESISILVTDLDRSPEPFAVLTGDTLFIGDVGRPDLSGDRTPQELAGMLYDSLHNKLMTLADDVEVYPAHGAGSLCGRQMSAERKSTIGVQRAVNYALRAGSRDEFVTMLTAELPDRPKYFSKDAELNRTGAGPLAELGPIPEIDPGTAVRLQRSGVVILDTRPAQDYAAGHIAGSLNIGLGGQFASWAGALLDLDTTIILVAEDDDHVHEARTRLARVGIEQIAGSVRVFDGVALAQITVDDLRTRLADPELIIVDVRRSTECAEGIIPGAKGMPLNHFDLDTLDRTKDIAVYCKGGYRSSIACGLLERAGFRHVINVIGGYDAWRTLAEPRAAAMKS